MRKDIDLSFTPNPLSGDIAIKKDRTAVEQSMKNIVLTNFYERGFNVELSGNINSSLFENYTSLLSQTIKNNIVNSMRNFEPNIEIDEVITEMQESNVLTVIIRYAYLNDYEIRTTIIPITRLR